MAALIAQGPIAGLGNLPRRQPERGVLRSPRVVPPLGIDTMVVKKPTATNDEVASILKGLQLDRKFFLARLDENLVKGLAPSQPKKRTPIVGVERESSDNAKMTTQRRIERMKSKVMKKVHSRQGAAQQPLSKTDFDIYLGEALMPVLAQALDSLCRQVNRMQMQGDTLDPKVRARFNPITWLAQQLLRRHPKCAKTPRRQAIYSNFRDWSDLEKGRREMLRRREVIKDVFDGFVLRGVVQRETIPNVISAIDDTLRLGGTLRAHAELQRAMAVGMDVSSNVPTSPTSPNSRLNSSQTRRSAFFSEVAWTFDEFWYRFASIIMSQDVVRFSAIKNGIETAKQEALMRSERDAASKKEEEERKARDEANRRKMTEYTELHALMQEDEHICSILNDGKILTGDDVRPGDIGFELEVPPKGQHCQYLAQFLILLGFEDIPLEPPAEKTETRPSFRGEGGYPQLERTATTDKTKVPEPEPPAPTPKKGKKAAEAPPPPVIKTETETKAVPRWWDDALASAWTVIQETHRAEIADGVVESEVLEQVFVPPVGFILLANKIADEMERRAEGSDVELFAGSRRNSQDDASAILRTGASKKPSIETLCQRLGITMARMEWLHRLFESFLEDDPDNPGVTPCCLYPECPAAIKKDQMRALIMEVRPDMEDVEFEMRFRRIDVDQSGMVEFDEFVTWVREDEVRVAGAAPSQKMSFEELAHVYDEDVKLIHYLHRCFQDRFDEDDEIDDYPKKPLALPKDEVRALVASLTPDMNDAEFETEFQRVTFSKKDSLDFDEFLEVLHWHELPAELLMHADD